MRGDREAMRGLARGARAAPAGRPSGGRGVIAQDFVFLGILTANKLSKFRENGPGRGLATAERGAEGTIRTERARGPGTKARSAQVAHRGQTVTVARSLG